MVVLVLVVVDLMVLMWLLGRLLVVVLVLVVDLMVLMWLLGRVACGGTCTCT